MARKQAFVAALYRVNDAADLLDVSRTTIYNYIRTGVLPRTVKYGPKLVGWPREVIDKWLAERAAALAPPAPLPGGVTPPWTR